MGGKKGVRIRRERMSRRQGRRERDTEIEKQRDREKKKNPETQAGGEIKKAQTQKGTWGGGI